MQSPSQDAAYWQECDGSSECKAVRHVHGCFADDGNCDDPTEHQLPGLGKLICRAIGHSWKWTGGWIEYECRRCGKRG